MAEKKQRYDDRMRLQDYRAVFGSGEGRRVLNDLMARHYLLGSTLSADPISMAHAEGQREVVLHILRYMQMTPSDIPQARISMLEQFELDVGEPSP
jgi:hypothetical protein